MMIINFCNYFVSDINLKVPKQKKPNKQQKTKTAKYIYIYIFYNGASLPQSSHMF